MRRPVPTPAPLARLRAIACVALLAVAAPAAAPPPSRAQPTQPTQATRTTETTPPTRPTEPPPSRAQPTQPPRVQPATRRRTRTPVDDDRVRVQYKGVALQRVIREIGEATGTRFIFGDDVRGVVTIAVTHAVSPAEALELLRAALYIKGYAQVPAGADAYKIVPIAMTPTDAEFVRRRLDEKSERAITTMVTLQHVSAEDVAETIKPLAPSSGAAFAYPPTNSIILSGTESALGRLISVVRLLDEAAAEQLWARVIRHRDVEELIEVADAALNEGWNRANHIDLFSDARTNMLFARGKSERLDALRAFVDRFDRLEAGAGGIHVVRVLNRDANEIVELISKLQAGAARSRDASREEPPDTVETEAGDEGREPAEALPTSETAQSLEGLEFTLTSDEHSRSIIIQAAQADAQIVADMIAELDRIAPRVAVELFYYEVQRPSSFLLSFDFIGTVGTVAPGGNSGGGVRFESTPGAGTTSPDPQNRGAFGRVAGAPLTLPFTNPITGDVGTIEFPANEGAVNASETGITVALLSRPSLTVMAGEEHELFVGNNVPIPVSSNAPVTVTNADGTTTNEVVNPLMQRQTIERQDVGTLLRLRPTVGEEGSIVLELTFEESRVVPSVVGVPGSEVGVTIAKRTIDSTTVLRPGEYVILGMAEEKKTMKSRTGVPWLRDIPGLGLLFSRVQEEVVDTRLIVAARARRLRSPADDIAETIRRRLAFERSISRVNDLEKIPDRPWAVRLATFEQRDRARRVAEAFDADGYVTRVSRWKASDGLPYWDVYLVGYPDYETAAIVAMQATDADWDGDVLMVPAINEMAPED